MATARARPRAPAPERLVTRLKLRQLALVIALAERRSLRQAANDVAVTQPAATKLLRDLESAVGLPLFTRHTWGMAPTPYGDTFVRHARSLVSELGEARKELSAQAAGATGLLRVGAVTGAVPSLAAPALQRMQAERPGVRQFVLVNTSELMLAALREGALDVVVCPLPRDANVDDLVVSRLADEPLRVVARRRHPLARRRAVTLQMLHNVPWLLQTQDTPLRRDVDAMLAGAGLPSPAQIIETVSIVATLALLQETDAVTAMPQALARHYGHFGMVAEIPLALDAPISRYELVTRARRELSPAAQAFVAMLKETTRRPRGQR